MSGKGDLRPIVRRFPDKDALADGAAELVSELIAAAIARRGKCALALAGGSTPRATYQRLANAVEDAAKPGGSKLAEVDWRRVEVFFGDERVVPPDDPASNYRMARATLLDYVPVAPARVHRIAGELRAVEAARRYSAELARHLPLDLALLGMGDDGHTASLFPGGPPTGQATVVATTSPAAPTGRVTLTVPVLSGARAVVFLISGAAKAARLAEVAAELRHAEAALPAARIRPASGALYWLVDEAAAAQLPAELSS